MFDDFLAFAVVVDKQPFKATGMVGGRHLEGPVCRSFLLPHVGGSNPIARRWGVLSCPVYCLFQVVLAFSRRGWLIFLVKPNTVVVS